MTNRFKAKNQVWMQKPQIKLQFIQEIKPILLVDTQTCQTQFYVSIITFVSQSESKHTQNDLWYLVACYLSL